MGTYITSVASKAHLTKRVVFHEGGLSILKEVKL